MSGEMELGSVASSLVAAILSKPLAHEWTLQGFGMLRLHINGEYRLNLWDSRYRVPDVSMMHTHPWNFTSLVVSGCLINTRYTKGTLGDVRYHRGLIKPGPGGGKLQTFSDAHLFAEYSEVYHSGEFYCQRHDEIHVSEPHDGTITLNRRVRTGEDVAEVFWRYGSEWVSAEPRIATVDEVLDITAAARRTLG